MGEEGGPQVNVAALALGGLLVLMIVAVGLRSWFARTVREAAEKSAPAPPTSPSPSPSEPSKQGYFPRVTLHGPDGDQTIPSRDSATVVNVWLQGCADCMPAFDAVRKAPPCKGRVVNVAYGQAAPDWAATYGVRTNLVFDHGGRSVVQPLGIHSFTTFVVNPDGKIVLQDRPDSPTYNEKLTPYCQ